MKCLVRNLLAGALLSLPWSAAGDAAVNIGQNFDGSVFGQDSPYSPPDPNGAVGPQHFVELINGRFSVYSKLDGTRVSTMTDTGFWAAAGLSLGTRGISDPRLVYDPLAGRWFASAIDTGVNSASSNRFLVAVSATVDPTGAWNAVMFQADLENGYFADFPTMGLNAQGVYVAGYLFDASGTELQTNVLVAIPKADLLGGAPSAARRQVFGGLAGSGYGHILQPSVNFDPGAAEEAVVAVGDLGYDFAPHSTLAGFSVQNVGGTGAPTLTQPAVFSVESYSVPINPAQPGGSTGLDDGDLRFSSTVYEVGGVLYAVHGVEVANRAALRWYRIRAQDHKVLQSGTISDVNLDLFYPSIAANRDGVVVIGYNGCGTSTYISAYAVAGETQNGQLSFGQPLLLAAGQSSYTYSVSQDGTYRWGDYSTTSVDPTDPYRFWTIQMYPLSSTQWATRISELRLALPTLSMTIGSSQATLSWPGTSGVFEVQSTSDLSATVWGSLGQGAAAAAGLVQLVVPIADGPQFFRLHQL